MEAIKSLEEGGLKGLMSTLRNRLFMVQLTKMQKVREEENSDTGSRRISQSERTQGSMVGSSVFCHQVASSTQDSLDAID